MNLLLTLVVLFCLMYLAESQDNPHYTVTDPAIREMLISLDMPRYTGNVPAENIAGNWQLTFDNRKYCELGLYQSGSAIFGRGKMTSTMVSQGVTASCSVFGSELRLDIVPESGTEFYAVSLDISRLPFAGTYIEFSANSAPTSGTLQANKNMPYIINT